MREYSVPAPFTVDEHDNVAGVVFSHERDDPGHVIFQRLTDGVWTDVTCAEAAAQIRAAALGLIAEGVQPGDRVAAYLPHVPETIVAFLAVVARARTSLGAPPSRAPASRRAG